MQQHSEPGYLESMNELVFAERIAELEMYLEDPTISEGVREIILDEIAKLSAFRQR